MAHRCLKEEQMVTSVQEFPCLPAKNLPQHERWQICAGDKYPSSKRPDGSVQTDHVNGDDNPRLPSKSRAAYTCASEGC